MSRTFNMTGRDLVVAKFTACQAMAEVLTALPTKGASLIRLSAFEVECLRYAVIVEQNALLAELDDLDAHADTSPASLSESPSQNTSEISSSETKNEA